MDNYAYEADNYNRISYDTNKRHSETTGPNDNVVEVHSKGKIFRGTTFYKRTSVILLLLFMLCLIGLVVIIVLYAKAKPKICTSHECLRSASNLKYSLDVTVDPCDNFYQYVCGNWPETHINHGWWSSFSSFTTIAEQVAIKSLKLLTDTSLIEDPEALQKSRNFFKSCMDVDALDVLGLTTIYTYLRKARLPIIPSIFTKKGDKNNFTFNWMRSEALIKQILMMDVFIGIAVDTNIYNGSENVIYIGHLYQRCPLPSPLNKKRNWKNRIAEKDYDENEFIKKNSDIISYIIREIIVNNTSEEPNQIILKEAVEIILNVTFFLQKLNTNYTNVEETEEYTFSIKFEELQYKIDDFLGKAQSDMLIKYFHYLFWGTNVTIYPETDLLYTTDFDIQYLQKVIRYVFNTSDLHMELYTWWVTVYAMIINTSSNIVTYVSKQLAFDEYNTVTRSRSLDCALLVNNFMGYSISYALADRYFLNKTKPKVDRMISDIKEAFVQRVIGINWMDKETKEVTIEKTKEMITFVGYPEWLFKEGELDEYYEDVIIKADTYLENMLNLIISYNLKKLVSLRKRREKDWHSEPIEVNAFNSFSDNAINVPMAILNFPLYNLGLEALNYGSIGTILGHELIHGFDNTGRKYDKVGNYIQWWTNKTIETFEILSECFINQYDNFTIDGVKEHVRGKNTLGENIADNGGLRQAFAAYKNYVNNVGEEPTLPGFDNFTNYQLFFIAYGSIWCESSTIQDLTEQIQFDEHSPNAIRVLGTLQNSADFAEAFQCSVGTLMNPKNKCKIW